MKREESIKKPDLDKLGFLLIISIEIIKLILYLCALMCAHKSRDFNLVGFFKPSHFILIIWSVTIGKVESGRLNIAKNFPISNGLPLTLLSLESRTLPLLFDL